MKPIVVTGEMDGQRIWRERSAEEILLKELNLKPMNDIKTEVNNLCECEPKCMSTEFINKDCKGLKSELLNKHIDREVADESKWDNGEYKPDCAECRLQDKDGERGLCPKHYVESLPNTKVEPNEIF